MFHADPMTILVASYVLPAAALTCTAWAMLLAASAGSPIQLIRQVAPGRR